MNKIKNEIPTQSSDRDLNDRLSMVGRVAKNSVVILLGKIIDITSSLIVLMILARILKPSLYGDYAFINAVVLAFQPLINLEINTILIREMAADRHREWALLGGGLLLKMILLAAFIVSAVILESIIQFNPMLRMAFYLAVAAEIFQQIVWVYSAVFMARERMEFEPLLSLVCKIVTVGGIGLLALFMSSESMETIGFVLVFAILAFSQLIRAVLGIFIAANFLKKFKIQWSFSVAKELFRQSWVMGLATFLTGLTLRIDIYFLKYFKSSEEIAIFNIPHMFTLQIQILAISLVTALFPVFSRLRAAKTNDTETFEIVQDASIRIMALLGLSITIVSGFFPNVIIRVLGGSAYQDSIPVLVILSWCIPILFLNYLGANLLTAMKRQNLLIYGAAASLISNAILDWLWIPVYGISGASYSTVISYLLQLSIIFYFLYRYSPDMPGLLQAIMLPTLFCLAALFGVRLFEKTFEVRSLASGSFRVLISALVMALCFAVQPASFRGWLRRFRGGSGLQSE